MTADDAPDVALRAEAIGYSYGDRVAAEDVTFDIASGEILGFLGPNGAGKSTTMKMLTGQLVPRTGVIDILGMRMPKQREEIQARIGVCFEEKNLYPSLTARENLKFFAQLFGVEGFGADALLERVGLKGRGGERVSGFSKGMQQRLMVGRALVNRPDVLFLDEPTDGLDPVSARAVRAIIKEEAERGAAVLLTTHDMHEADALSDRVAFINDGRILALDSPESLKLRHGRRAVKLRFRNGDAVEEEVVALDAAAGEQLRSLVSRDGLLTIHTEEATLEDVFVEFAGRRLE
ncbi:MAG: ATP-binding cassette domain-containing protein [Nitriliruptorales bacterium]|nr:ATP-binding cassette domain-containing protein [Nitriliruptorales bacterium]